MSRSRNEPPPSLALDSANDDDFDMLDLEPTPMPDSPIQPTVEFSTISSPPSSNIPHGTTVIRWLTRTQKYSSYAFTSFLGAHFVTTGLIPLVSGVEAGDNSLTLARVFYQTNPVIEAALIPGSLIVHTLSGLSLRIYRHREQTKRYGRAPKFLSGFSKISVTGYILVPLLAAHAILMRVIPLYFEGDSSEIGLGYVAHGFDYHQKIGRWVSSLYYIGFVGIASSHVVHGMAKWWKVKSRRKANAVVLTMAGLWLAGLWSVVRSMRSVSWYLARKYDKFYDTLLRRLMFRL